MFSNCGAVEDSWESLGTKKIKPVNLKGNQPHILFGRTDSEAPIHWPPNVNSWLIGKDPDAGKDWRQKKKRVTKDEMVGWHHQLKGHELGQIRICLLLEEMVWDREVWCVAGCEVTKSQTWPGNWTTTTVLYEL